MIVLICGLVLVVGASVLDFIFRSRMTRAGHANFGCQ